MHLTTAAEMQAMDRQTIEDFGLPGRVLMENAGRGAVRIFLEHFKDAGHRKIGVLAGRGNNGGDGYVIARYLAQRGCDVRIFLLARREEIKGDAAANLALLTPLDIAVFELPDEASFRRHTAAMQEVEIWIDAILGTGLKAAVRGPAALGIETLNRSGRPILAVDIPSGLDADTGQPCGASVRASVTVTFGCAKIGHLLYPGADLSGRLYVVDIGIPAHIVAAVAPAQALLTPQSVRPAIRPRPADAHKGQAGHLLVVAGSTGKTGAAALTATAALRGGAGLVTLGLPSSLNPGMEVQVTEAMTWPLPEAAPGILGSAARGPLLELAADKQALALGPGLGTHPETCRLVHALLAECPLPIVLDADGLNCLAADRELLRRRQAPSILTPHPGEMARLTGQTTTAVQQDRIGSARRLATAFQIHVVLKGARTIIAHPDGRVRVNPTGNPGMASGGMGDVLTGVIGGLLAQGYDPATAAETGVYLHGLAADRRAAVAGAVGLLATDVLQALPGAWRTLDDPLPADVPDLEPFL